MGDFFRSFEDPEVLSPVSARPIQGQPAGDTASPGYETHARESVRQGGRYPLLGWQAETLFAHCASGRSRPPAGPGWMGSGSRRC